MALFPQSNARLLQIARGGFTEDYNRTTGTQPPVWIGDVDAYVQTRMMSNFNDNGELNRVMATTIIIPGDLPVMLEPGDQLTYAMGDPQSPITLVARVQSFNNPAELASLPDYFKCAIEQVEAIAQ